MAAKSEELEVSISEEDHAAQVQQAVEQKARELGTVHQEALEDQAAKHAEVLGTMILKEDHDEEISVLKSNLAAAAQGADKMEDLQQSLQALQTEIVELKLQNEKLKDEAAEAAEAAVESAAAASSAADCKADLEEQLARCRQDHDNALAAAAAAQRALEERLGRTAAELEGAVASLEAQAAEAEAEAAARSSAGAVVGAEEAQRAVDDAVREAVAGAAAQLEKEVSRAVAEVTELKQAEQASPVAQQASP